MSERLNNVATDLKLSDSRYVELLQVYRKQARGDVQKEAKEILINNLSEGPSIKWLAVGAGLGDREKDILQTLRKKTSNLTVELFRAYEPNKETASYLKKAIEESNSSGDVWSCTKKISILAEPFTVDTDLGDDKYDLITLPHVLYYYRTREERAKLFKQLVEHLSPGGIIWSLVFAKADDSGNTNQHFQMYKELKPLVVKAKGEVANADKGKGSGGNLVMSDSLWEEWKTLADDMGLAKSKDTLTWKLFLGNDAKGKTRIDILSFLLDVEIKNLPEETIDEMLEWIERNAKEVSEEKYLGSVDSLLTFVNSSFVTK